jgi:hypothetical protein
MRIALLISGRAVRYELCLLPILEKANYEVHLFMSINDTKSLYYDVMQDKLKLWLKVCNITPYIIPSDFKNLFKENNYRYCYQNIDGEWKPRNQLSMYWNDNQAFTMATQYAKENNFSYDIFMRFRADIFNTQLPLLTQLPTDELCLHSIDPLCCFTSFGIHPTKIVSSDWVWGNEKTMQIFCNTYSFVLQKNKELNNEYIFHYESNHTDCMLENGVNIIYYKIHYNIDSNRKIFDTTWIPDEKGVTKDSRKVPPHGFAGYAFNPSLTTTEHIPLVAE